MVWIWFGTAKPDTSLLEGAQQQLDTLELPERGDP